MNYEQIMTKIEAFKFTFELLFIPINVDVLTSVKVTQMIKAYADDIQLYVEFKTKTFCLN